MRFSVIIATLNRPTLERTLHSLQNQAFRDYEVVTHHNPAVNEYIARNQAVANSKGEILAIIDDDAYANKDWLLKAEPHFARGMVVLTGKIVGNLLGTGIMVLDRKYLGTGMNLFIRREAFDFLGGFEANWGLGRKVPGWRADTDLLWRAVDRFGSETYAHDSNVIVYHPSPLHSRVIPEIEEVFVRRHLDKCKRYLAPVDSKIREVVRRVEQEDLR